MNQPELTSGCLQVLMSGEAYDTDLVLQVLDKKRPLKNYRLLLSDGKILTSFITVDASLNDLAAELTEYSIIQVHKFEVIACGSRYVLKINQFTVLKKGEETNGKIGDPVAFDVFWNDQQSKYLEYFAVMNN